MENQNYQYISAYGKLVGKSHLPNDIPCQDNALCVQKNGVSVAVLSDGCGSSEISQYGSQITVESIANLFIDNFDDIYNKDYYNIEEQLKVRKLIIDTIIKNEKKFVYANEDIFQDYLKKKGDSKIGDKDSANYMDFCLRSLYSTLLFFAEKDGRYILGRIGDGVLGALIDDKLRIVLEEKKEGEVNGTLYPYNLYYFAKTNIKYYLHVGFELKRPANVNINGVILSSDGCSSLFCFKKDYFHKRYVSEVNDIFEDIVKCPDSDSRNKLLVNKYINDLCEKSSTLDDCSLAILIKKDFVINEFTIKEYKKPVLADEEPSAPSKPQVIPTTDSINEAADKKEEIIIGDDKNLFIDNDVERFCTENQINFDNFAKDYIEFKDKYLKSNVDNDMDETKIIKFLKVGYLESIDPALLINCDIDLVEQLNDSGVIDKTKYDERVVNIVIKTDEDLIDCYD